MGDDAVGNLSGYTYPSGVQTSCNYDRLNRLTQMGSAKNGALSGYAYTLGAAGNRLTVAELSGRSVAHGYDSLYRLTSETVTVASAEVGVDAQCDWQSTARAGDGRRGVPEEKAVLQARVGGVRKGTPGLALETWVVRESKRPNCLPARIYLQRVT
jgi:YD repeat-containing protein